MGMVHHLCHHHQYQSLCILRDIRDTLILGCKLPFPSRIPLCIYIQGWWPLRSRGGFGGTFGKCACHVTASDTRCTLASLCTRGRGRPHLGQVRLVGTSWRIHIRKFRLILWVVWPCKN